MKESTHQIYGDADMQIEKNAPPGTLTRVIGAASIGNFVEWFDFAVYGFLATTIANRFFPGTDANLSLLKTFGVFAVAFAMRPLGGMFFGVLGDKIGRKSILSITILLMAGATTLIGFLPTYDSVGILAAVLLTLLRCVQGFSAGGEYAGSVAYVMEHAPREKRGWYGSFIPVSTFSAFAAAALVAFVLETVIPAADMATWGWRVPFLIAAPLGIVGLYLRHRMEETPAFQVLSAQEKVSSHSPLYETLRNHTRSICRLGAFISLTALSFYTFTTYFATYLQIAGGLSRSQSLMVSLIALVLSAAACPLAGLFTDRIGRRKTIAFVCLWTMLAVLPAFFLAGTGSVLGAIAGVLLLAVGAFVSNVVTAALLSETFPTRTRYTASAFTYNLSYTVFGGTAPLMATWLIAVTGSNLAPAFYLMTVAVLAILGGLALPETSSTSLFGEIFDPDENRPGPGPVLT